MSGVRRVLIAGGTGPIGTAIARRLDGRGCALAIHYHRSHEAAARVLPGLTGASRHIVLRADLLEPASARDLVSLAEAQLGGPLDAVVNCAWPSPSSGALAEVRSPELEASLDGLRAHLNLCQASIPSLRRTAGSLVFLSGALAHRRHPGLGLYSLGKAAAESACLTLALEEGAHGVRVNVIAPGRVDLGPDPVEEDEAFAGLEVIAASRRSLPLPVPEEIAGVVAFLLGPDSTAVTGQVLAVAGGEQW